MKYNSLLIFILLTGISLSICTCNKKDESVPEKIEDYVNMQVGKYIRYNLDSLVYTDFDRVLTTRKYQAKDVVDAIITDALGRRSWRVIRYLRDSTSTNEADWKPNITYMVTLQPRTVEVSEENIRYIKLAAPLAEGNTWKGNSYIHPDSFDPSFSINSWDYTYANVGSPFTDEDGKKTDSTLTVNQIDEVLGNPNNPFTYTIRNYSQEVYGKHVGLVYKSFFHSEYQTFYSTSNCYYVKCTNNKCDTLYCAVNDNQCDANNIANGYKKYCRDTTLTDHYYIGYGIKLKMVDHN